ncbi:MAG: acyltransferase [Gordonia polyisoprenivorans]|nr:acyltransferase [Gordonia polyisoprenivorans]
MAGGKSLNKFRSVQRTLQRMKWLYYTGVWGMDLDPTVLMSLSARLDRTFPGGIHLGRHVYVAFEATILTHDLTRGIYLHTRVGDNCFIGARSVVMPGVTVGSNSIVGTGAVVTKDVPARSVVVGNPATVIRTDIEVGPYGRLIKVDAT